MKITLLLSILVLTAAAALHFVPLGHSDAQGKIRLEQTVSGAVSLATPSGPSTMSEASAISAVRNSSFLGAEVRSGIVADVRYGSLVNPAGRLTNGARQLVGSRDVWSVTLSGYNFVSTVPGPNGTAPAQAHYLTMIVDDKNGHVLEAVQH